MATIIHLSATHNSSPSIHLFSSHSPQNTPNPSFNLPTKAHTFRSISLKPYVASKPQALVITLMVKTLSETKLVTVPDEVEIIRKLPAGTGVYAIFDQSSKLQFVGL
ncbi:hypothetical protein ACFX2G_044129 [Malus domestica]